MCEFFFLKKYLMNILTPLCMLTKNRPDVFFLNLWMIFLTGTFYLLPSSMIAPFTLGFQINFKASYYFLNTQQYFFAPTKSQKIIPNYPVFSPVTFLENFPILRLFETILIFGTLESFLLQFSVLFWFFL